jgi:hypothetical protein
MLYLLHRLCSIEWEDDYDDEIGKDVERKQLWSVLSYCANICLERLRKAMKKLRKDGFWAKNLTLDLPNMKKEWYSFDCYHKGG